MWIALISLLIWLILLIIANKISKMKRFSKGFKVSETDLKKINKWNYFSWFDTILESIFFAGLLTWIDNAFENIIHSFLFYFVGYILLSIISKQIYEVLMKKIKR